MNTSAGDDLDNLTVGSTGDERRRYNRRRTESVPPPPYFSVFERMADALEDIVKLMTVAIRNQEQSGTGTKNAPPAEASVGGPSYPRPRQSGH